MWDLREEDRPAMRDLRQKTQDHDRRYHALSGALLQRERESFSWDFGC